MKALLALLIPVLALAAPAAGKTNWVLTDLSLLPELAAFFGDADAVITVKKEEDEGPEVIRPTIFVYKLQKKPPGRLKSGAEWQNFLKSYIKDPKRLILSQDTSKPGRYVLEFTSRNRDTKTDLRSLYLAIQSPDKSVSLFIYDGVGPSTARNLPQVRALFNELDQPRLMEMYQADIQRRKELKKTAP